MDPRTYLIVYILRAVTGTFLWLWMRRDRGHEPEDRLPQALQEIFSRRR